MEWYKPFILFFLVFVFFVYYRKIKKGFIILFILSKRIKFVNNKKILNIDNNENSKIITNRTHTPHDYSSEEEMPPSPVSYNKDIKKD